MSSSEGISESLYWIKHKDSSETYNRATDSLEAIKDALSGFDPSWVATQMLIDADNFDVADADANTERWTPEYITGADEAAADINTTTANALYMKINSTGAGAREYAVARELPLQTRYFSVYADASYTWGTVTATAMRGGIMISRGSAYDADNYIRVYKEKSTGVERISYSYNFGAGGDTAAAIVSTTDDAIAFKIDRIGTVFRIYYSLTQGGDAVWVLGAQVEDTADNIDDNPSFYFNIYSVGSAASEDVQVDFDTWRLGNNFGAFVDTIVSGFDSADIGADVDGAVLERLESLQAALSVGIAASGEFEEDGSTDLWDALVADSSSDANITTTTGDRDGAIIQRLAAIISAMGIVDAAGGQFEEDASTDLWDALVVDSSTDANITSLTGNRDGAIIERLSAIINALNITDAATGSGFEEDGSANIVTALGTDGVTVTDSAVSILGAVGADNANNAFASTSVVANEDGSVLERLEQVQEAVNKGTGTAIGANKSLVDALGSNGLAVADSAVSVLGAVGADNANNAFASTAVVANEDGSVLERLEQIQEAVNVGTGTSMAANKSIADALGSDGTTVTDAAVSVLGAIGANNADNAFASNTVVANRDGSVLERQEFIIDEIDSLEETGHEVGDVVIYPVAEDISTTEITDDGTTPALTAPVSQSNKTEAEGIGTPAWTEDINFEQAGTIAVISIYFELYWQQQFTVGAGAGTTTSAKWQISGDGGSTWVDVTDNVTENNAAYQDKTRLGVSLPITAITAGANQLQLRLCAWTDDAGGVSTVETKVRSNSYLRVTYRKS